MCRITHSVARATASCASIQLRRLVWPSSGSKSSSSTQGTGSSLAGGSVDTGSASDCAIWRRAVTRRRRVCRFTPRPPHSFHERSEDCDPPRSKLSHHVHLRCGCAARRGWARARGSAPGRCSSGKATKFAPADRLAGFDAPTVWHEFTPLAKEANGGRAPAGAGHCHASVADDVRAAPLPQLSTSGKAFRTGLPPSSSSGPPSRRSRATSTRSGRHDLRLAPPSDPLPRCRSTHEARATQRWWRPSLSGARPGDPHFPPVARASQYPSVTLTPRLQLRPGAWARHRPHGRGHYQHRRQRGPLRRYAGPRQPRCGAPLRPRGAHRPSRPRRAAAARYTR